MKRAFKYLTRSLLILLAIALLVLASLLVLIQTPFGKRQIVDIVENQAEKLLTSSLSIGKIEGNFFSNITIQDIWLHNNNDTLAHIQELRLSYRLLSLRGNTIQIDQISIDKPYVFLQQLPDSSWNLMHLMHATEPDTSSSYFDMRVQLDQFILRDGSIRISSPDSIIPKQINDLQISLSAFYSSKKQSLELKEFGFSSLEPTLHIQKLMASIEADETELRVKKAQLQTSQNELNLVGNYHFNSKKNTSSIALSVAPLHLEEFAYFLPPNFSLKINPTIRLDANMRDTKLNLKMQVQNDQQGIVLDLLSDHLVEYFSDSSLTDVPNYELTADIQQVDLRDWLNDQSLHYVLNGKFNIDGEGLDPQTLSTRLYGGLNRAVANGIALRGLNVDLYYRAGNVSGLIDANASFGSLTLVPSIQSVLGDRPTYHIDLNTKNLNIEPFAGKDYKSSINLHASITGSGIDPKTMAAKALIVGHPSRLLSFEIDTIHSEINYAKQNITVKSLLLKTLNALISAHGNYSLIGASDLQLAVNIEDAKEITDFLKIDSLNSQLALTAQLTGLPEDLTAKIALGLQNTVYKTISLNSLQIDATAQLQKKALLFDAHAWAKGLDADGFKVDSVILNAWGSPQKLDLNLLANNADIHTNLSSSVAINENIEIALSRLGLNYGGYDWNLQTDTAHILIKDNNYSIKDFVLHSPGSIEEQTIQADGVFSLDSTENFSLNIRQVDLPQIAQLFMPNQKIEGLFDAELLLSGTAQQPVLASNFSITNAGFDDIKFSTFEGDFNYHNKQLSSQVEIIAFDSGLAKLQLRMPAQIRLDSISFDFVGDKQSPIEGLFIVEKLPLSLINVFYPTDEIKGFLASDISVKGSMSQPLIDGKVDLKDGKLKINKYGIDYRNMQAAMSFANNVVSIDTFHIGSRKGQMLAKGDMRFESNLYEGKMNAAGLSIWFDDFKPIDHKQYHMELNGKVDVKADKDSTRFSGDLSIPEAMIFIPAIMNLMGKTMETNLDLPLLAAQLQKDSLMRDSVVFSIRPDTTLRRKDEETSNLAFLNNLQGKLNLKIPRNFWIKNNDMRLELGGDIQLIKHKDFFELFGPINVLRGQYSLLGKVFVIKSGVITFEGGKDMNPQLAVQAQYSFRDAERIKHDLTLNVGGYLMAPEISFNYEDRPISEGDALSYILFGTDLSSLGAAQQASVGSNSLDAGGIAQTAVASLLSSQLTKLLGNTLNMDYIEVKSGSFDNASFVVGKYLTDKIFISYEQNIGKIENTDVARYEMRMEYELFKFLFLQLTSSSLTNGLDVIFKFDEKQD